MVDRSHRGDLPNFCMIDANDNVRVVVIGAWKGTYDNELRMSIAKAPFARIESKFAYDRTIEASQTDGPAMAHKFVHAINGEEDPHETAPAVTSAHRPFSTSPSQPEKISL